MTHIVTLNPQRVAVLRAGLAHTTRWRNRLAVDAKAAQDRLRDADDMMHAARQRLALAEGMAGLEHGYIVKRIQETA